MVIGVCGHIIFLADDPGLESSTAFNVARARQRGGVAHRERLFIVYTWLHDATLGEPVVT